MHPVSQSALTDTSAVSMIAQESAVRVFPYKLVNSARGLQSFYRQSLYIHWKLLAKSDSHSAENSANFDVLYYYRYTLKGLNGILLARADPSFNLIHEFLIFYLILDYVVFLSFSPLEDRRINP